MDARDAAPMKCTLCRNELLCDDDIGLQGKHTVTCLACYTRLTETPKQMDTHLRRMVAQVVNDAPERQ